MYLFHFISVILNLIYISLTQLKKSEAWAKQYLTQLEQTYNGQFDTTVISKVAKYQSIQLHFVANAFSGLFNRKNNHQEQLRNLQYFLTTVLYDALIDESKLDEERLNEMFYHPEQAKPTNFEERVLIAMHLELLNQVPDKQKYWSIIEKVHLAQKDSAKQFLALTSKEEIIDITKRKGGYSLMMCRHYLMDPIHESIDNCWYYLGGLIQMTNDLFDTYKDTNAGIRTFANEARSISEIETTYSSQKLLLKESISKLPINYNHKKNIAIQLAIIPAFGDIAIQQIKGIQSNSATLPNFKDIPRKSLIIDMELFTNKCKLIKYAYENGKLWM